MADKPITRKELFMAKAGGQDVKTPEPITREERFLDAIAKNGGGSGSGLPPITPESRTEVFEEQSVAFEYFDGFYSATVSGLPLVGGELYAVMFDGVRYTLKATDWGEPVTIGNAAYALNEPGLDTGEPFVIVYYTDDQAHQSDIMVLTDEATHTVGVELITVPQSPADGTALSVKDGEWKAAGQVLPGFSKSMSVIMESQTIPFSDMQGMYVAMIQQEFPIEPGSTIVTTWDGQEYTCTAVDVEGEAGAYWGNLAMLGFPDTGEPFIGAYITGIGLVFYALESTAASHVIQMDGEAQTPPNGYVLGVDDGEWKAIPLEKPVLIKLSTEWESGLSVSSGSTYEFVSDETFPPEYIGIEDLLVLSAFCTSHPQLMYTGDGYIDTEQSTLHLTFINPTANAVTDPYGPVFITVFLVSPEESSWIALVAGE